MSKIQNSRTILEQSWKKKGFFQLHFQYQKNPEQFKEFKEFQNHSAPQNTLFLITCIPSVIFLPPSPGKGSPSYFGNSPPPSLPFILEIPLPPSKVKFEVFHSPPPPQLGVGGERGSHYDPLLPLLSPLS